MDVRRVIGTNVRRLRLERDLSQEAVAALMGVDRAYVSALELGRRNPTVITLWHAAQALQVSLADLVQDGAVAAEEMPPRKRARRRSSGKT